MYVSVLFFANNVITVLDIINAWSLHVVEFTYVKCNIQKLYKHLLFSIVIFFTSFACKTLSPGAELLSGLIKCGYSFCCITAGHSAGHSAVWAILWVAPYWFSVHWADLWVRVWKLLHVNLLVMPGCIWLRLLITGTQQTTWSLTPWLTVSTEWCSSKTVPGRANLIHSLCHSVVHWCFDDTWGQRVGNHLLTCVYTGLFVCRNTLKSHCQGVTVCSQLSTRLFHWSQ